MEKQLLSDPRARQRLRWIQRYEQITKKVSPTCRYFGISRGTFYCWYHRYLSLGVSGLKSKSCRPHKIHRWLPKEIRETVIALRLQRKYGPRRMSWYLGQKHNSIGLLRARHKDSLATGIDDKLSEAGSNLELLFKEIDEVSQSFHHTYKELRDRLFEIIESFKAMKS